MTSRWEGLGRLQILDFAYTAIKELPIEVGKLIKLRELNLYHTESLESIPAGLCSMLSSLEILDMERSRYMRGLKGAVEDGEAYLEELESLDTLRELLIQVKPKSSLTWIINPTWIERLRRFSLCIGAMPRGTYYAARTKREMVMNSSNLTKEERTEYLLSATDATFLWFHRCVGCDKLVQNMGLNTKVCFSTVKWLSIHDASIHLGDTLEAKFDLLPNLETLRLRDVSGLTSISELVHHLGLTLSKLQMLLLTLCYEMKYLFSAGHPLDLKSLTKITIQDCGGLEELFEYALHQAIIVPNLKEVNLYELPVLRTLCANNNAVPWSGLEIISVIGCDRVRKLPISGTNNSLRKIIGKEFWWSNLEWDDLDTKTSLQHLFQIHIPKFDRMYP